LTAEDFLSFCIGMGIIKSITENEADYLRDESRLVGKAEYICFAREECDIHSAIAFCRGKGVPFTIQGSRTGITGGCVPEEGLVLNMEKMNKVIGIRQDAEGNFYLRCQPGLKLIELNAILARKELDTTKFSQSKQEIWRNFVKSGSYIFPPDPTETTASLGGMASCNASGARSFYYGATRRWISDMKVVVLNLRADISSFAEAGEKYLLKNIKSTAGYYLSVSSRDFDHFIGAEGTLGIITELELRLLKKPSYCWGVMQFFGGEESALAFVEELKQMAFLPAAIEYFDSNSLNLLRMSRHLWDTLPQMEASWHCGVYYEYESDDEENLEEAVFSAAAISQKSGSSESDCWFADTEVVIRQLKEFRHAVPEAINEELDKIRRIDKRIAKISTDFSVPEGSLRDMIIQYRLAEQKGWRVIVFGHIGNNHLHTNILPGDYEEYLKGRRLAEEWSIKAVQLGGSVSGEHGIGKIKHGLLKIMYSAEALNIFRGVKKEFDPEWLINRGNIIDYQGI
jgi:D-lactate dehydrogenase (cytochrome)